MRTLPAVLIATLLGLGGCAQGYVDEPGYGLGYYDVRPAPVPWVVRRPLYGYGYGYDAVPRRYYRHDYRRDYSDRHRRRDFDRPHRRPPTVAERPGPQRTPPGWSPPPGVSPQARDLLRRAQRGEL